MAIYAQANRLGYAHLLKPVVAITAPNGGGFGIPAREGGAQEKNFSKDDQMLRMMPFALLRPGKEVASSRNWLISLKCQ